MGDAIYLLIYTYAIVFLTFRTEPQPRPNVSRRLDTSPCGHVGG